MHDGYTDVAPGKLPNVETRLEMHARPQARPDPAGVTWALERFTQPVDLQRYLALFRRVGEPYLWASRLAIDESKLASILNDPNNEVYALREDDEDAGILELDFRVSGECEITFFGVIDRLVGTGGGRWLMNRAIDRAWSRDIKRFWVHTCTLDHPRAVDFYIRSGFKAYERKIEILDDPRLTGVLPRTAAPDVPIL